MKIINITKNTLLAEEVMVADTFLKRMRGLLGKKEFRKGQALILNPCNSIHTFFMYFPIDVVFVDRHNQVIEVISSLRPGSLTRIYFNATFAIELPEGTLKSTLTSKGDTLLIE
jgi:uncharacterized membrane protein (UPF0127 family)